MKIVGGPSSTGLSRKISEASGMPVVKTTSKRFPDGEFYFKFEEGISGEDLLLVQSLYPPQDSHLIELLMMVHTAEDLGAGSIITFIPYLAYSRQDERYLEGECISSSMVMKVLEDLGVDSLYTIDVHNISVLEKYKIPTHNLTAAGKLASYFASKDLNDPIVVAPDDEELALTRAEHASNVISTDYDYLRKKRDRYSGEIKTFANEINVEGRDVIIIDDIISTGKTTANAASILKAQGAGRVFAGVSHLLLMGGALDLLRERGIEEVAGTDSVQSKFAKISVASLITKALSESDTL